MAWLRLSRPQQGPRHVICPTVHSPPRDRPSFQVSTICLATLPAALQKAPGSKPGSLSRLPPSPPPPAPQFLSGAPYAWWFTLPDARSPQDLTAQYHLCHMGIFHLQSLSTICIIGLSFSWAVLGFELVRQLLYHLSRTLSPLCFGYF